MVGQALQQGQLADRLGVQHVRDRMGVILDIFASRARTNEAKLQVPTRAALANDLMFGYIEPWQIVS
jgi:50S ribosomal subunit-associated GTPase HflX